MRNRIHAWANSRCRKPIPTHFISPVIHRPVSIGKPPLECVNEKAKLLQWTGPDCASCDNERGRTPERSHIQWGRGVDKHWTEPSNSPNQLDGVKRRGVAVAPINK